MPVYRDYEIRIKIDHIAHALRSDLDLKPIYKQVHDEIAKFCEQYNVEMP